MVRVVTDPQVFGLGLPVAHLEHLLPVVGQKASLVLQR